ncbi:MAG TPA: methyltransferase [Chitinophagaceae bacterium]|nr:methyltransferase [Chitinophagaceae bacterium]
MFTQTLANDVVISPSRILQVGYGFWSSKVLLTAVNFELFTFLSGRNKTAAEIKAHLKLQDRGLTDFLDALVALKFLYREGHGEDARYGNTLEADSFLDKTKPSYIGGIMEMVNNRLYNSWSHLDKALQTGLPQNEIQKGEQSAYDILYHNEQKLAEFVHAMSGAQRGSFTSFAKQFDSAGYQTLCDLGGAAGDLAIQVAIHHPEMRCISFDLPQVAPIAQRNIEKYKVEGRVSVASGDFFNDDFPATDVLTMGNILHNWSLEKRKVLIKKAYDTLPKGGALVVIENMIDDERRESTFGLLMSLNMLINTTGGSNFSAADFTGWAREAGFVQVKIMHLTGSASALIAYK